MITLLAFGLYNCWEPLQQRGQWCHQDLKSDINKNIKKQRESPSLPCDTTSSFWTGMRTGSEAIVSAPAARRAAVNRLAGNCGSARKTTNRNSRSRPARWITNPGMHPVEYKLYYFLLHHFETKQQKRNSQSPTASIKLYALYHFPRLISWPIPITTFW